MRTWLSPLLSMYYFLQIFYSKTWKEEHNFLEHHLMKLLTKHPYNTEAWVQSLHFICRGFTCNSMKCPGYLVAASFKRGDLGFQGLHGSEPMSKMNILSWLHPFTKYKYIKWLWTGILQWQALSSVQPFPKHCINSKSSFAKTVLQAPTLLVSE